MSSTNSQLAEKNLMYINHVRTTQLNSNETDMSEQYTSSEPPQQQHYTQATTDYDQYNIQQKNDLLRSLAQNPHMLNDFYQFLEFTRTRSLQQSFPPIFNSCMNQDQHQIPSLLNFKKDYTALVTTEKWPMSVKNIPVKITKPSYITDCFALVVRYVPRELEIETVKEEINRTITSADNIKQIHYAYERRSNDFRFIVTDLKEYNSAVELGRNAICNHWLSITPFLSGNCMNYCTKCWRISHVRDQCKTNIQRCRVCLENRTRKEDHKCTNVAKCDGEHHSLCSPCHVIRQYRADLKENVTKAVESGNLQ
ncbi:unnamed protein product [Didymodactylos carnosus]|uniref:Uncharacterized protein n=1 Tax=Didymodactylos carnosus TaxID=1234261 RepID=A0A8S2T7G5_9BILA|nr:unnamed protein product [Didymodactylos carnosus]CAF4267025.1 unnamed protein product [Didymodactylos carnosus]